METVDISFCESSVLEDSNTEVMNELLQTDVKNESLTNRVTVEPTTVKYN